MKISVITVSYNSEATIEEAIKSVLSQTHADIEYIVVDGCSTDETVNIIGQYKDRIDRFVSEPDRGIYDAMNRGIQLATGDIVGMLNSDDVFEDRCVLADIARPFEADPETEIVFGDVAQVRRKDLTKIVRYYRSSHFRRWKLRYGWMPPHPSTFVRKSVYDTYGHYRLRFQIAADYEMFVRWLLVHRLTFSHIDRVLVRMRRGGISTGGFRNSVLLNREIVDACRSNGVYTNLFMTLTKVPANS